MTRGREVSATAPPAGEAALWHDVECGGYTADLPLWRELAQGSGGPVLEIGAGTGRVALDLAERGYRVNALDSDPELIAELARRARQRGLRVDATAGDARAFELGRRFGVVVAPMQVTQLLGGPDGRRSMLAAVRRHMDAGAVLALALADPLEDLPVEDALPPLPDVRERGGWIYSSRPVAMRDAGGAIAIERIREAVSPTGAHGESAATLMLDRVDAAELEAMATSERFCSLPRRSVPATEAYVGSEVVMLEAS